MIKDIQEEIIRLKKERGAVILAHCYQTHDILECADYVGDSFGLAQNARKTDAQTVIMCGVRFMAETVKILCPEKTVLLPEADAGCPMAEMISPEKLRELRARYPEHAVVAYINTTAELKTLCDVCVTSSSAAKIIRKMSADKILFIPDKNLGSYIAAQCPEKEIVTVNGCCPVHAAITEADVEAAKKAHPNALLLVHPECDKTVVERADYVGSTTEIMDFAKKSPENEFIIGTENSIVQHLGVDCPEKRFFPLSKNFICRNMQLTKLASLLHCLQGDYGEEITMSEETRLQAKKSIDEMLRLGNG
ncbi:MAG: quinolinate synthase NadA [Oscillospiraceae bacterium]|nr:quinolinate synthase NadA [Oscillospiraceae bacterium]